jgi:micrococcal nuclease
MKGVTMYQYRATVDRWVDGDTVDMVVDLGFRMTTHQRFRLLGDGDTPVIDTPERGEPGYVEARQVSESVHPPGSVVIVSTEKPLAGDKYGRYLVLLPEVNAALRASGLLKDGSK